MTHRQTDTDLPLAPFQKKKKREMASSRQHNKGKINQTDRQRGEWYREETKTKRENDSNA